MLNTNLHNAGTYYIETLNGKQIAREKKESMKANT